MYNNNYQYKSTAKHNSQSSLPTVEDYTLYRTDRVQRESAKTPRSSHHQANEREFNNEKFITNHLILSPTHKTNLGQPRFTSNVHHTLPQRGQTCQCQVDLSKNCPP